MTVYYFVERLVPIVRKCLPKKICNLGVNLLNWRNFKGQQKYNKYTVELLRDDMLEYRLNNLDKALNSDKKIFYVISRPNMVVGLFSFMQTTMLHICYALAKGYIPVVDMQNYPNTYLPKKKIGEENSWEYFFKQPCGYGLNDIIGRGSRVIKGSGDYWPSQPSYTSFDDYEIFNFWSTIFNRFFHLCDDAENYIDKECKKILNNGRKVMGVSIRGTDYSLKSKNHPIQPDINDVINRVEKSMSDWNCDCIFLATEERKIVQIFDEHFPDKVLTVHRKYYDEVENSESELTPAITFNRENDEYLRGMEYLASIMILVKCNCLISVITSATPAVLYINGGQYENKYIYQLGVY